MAKKKQDRFNAELAKKRERKKKLVARSPNFQKRHSKLLDKPFVDEGIRPTPLDAHTLLMKRLAEKARAQNEAAGDGESHAPSSTKGFAMATQKRREELQAKQRAEEKAAKEKEKYAAAMSKKKPASELLGAVSYTHLTLPTIYSV